MVYPSECYIFRYEMKFIFKTLLYTFYTINIMIFNMKVFSVLCFWIQITLGEREEWKLESHQEIIIDIERGAMIN